MPGRQGRSVAEIRSMLEGPVNAIPTSFTADGEIDIAGVRNVIDTAIDAGSDVTLLTYGTSQFDWLSEQDIVELTRLSLEHAGDRTLFVAANKRALDTRATVAFAEFCREIGVDVLMTLPANQMLGQPPTDLAAYYRAVAEVIPVMLVGAPDHDLLDLLVDEPRICCFKEDGTEAYAVRTMRRYGDRWTFMTGGQFWRHFTQWPFGCRAYFSVWCCLDAGTDRRYWEAMQGGDLDVASDIVSRQDAPLFDIAEGYPGGWETVWRAALELRGVACRYRRPPAHSLTDAELESLRPHLRKVGIAC